MYFGVNFKCSYECLLLLVRAGIAQSVIATGYMLDDRLIGVRFGGGGGWPTPALVHTQPLIQCVPGVLSLGVKRTGREAYHSPPATAEFEERKELYLHSQIRLRSVVLSKVLGQLYLLLFEKSDKNILA
jgi:hypothetical protein